MALKFSVDEDTNHLIWDHREASAGITEQQAMIIAARHIAENLGHIAEALTEIAETIGRRRK